VHNQPELLQARNLTATITLLTLAAAVCSLVAGYGTLLGGIATGLMVVVLLVLTAQWARAHAALRNAEEAEASSSEISSV
jgi:hypothetical protein